MERLNLVSVNLRVRTPGPVALIASGGLSYLPDIHVDGSIPLDIQNRGPARPPGGAAAADARRNARPGRAPVGVNAGAGIRVGGRVAFVGEARIFYFPDYELRFVLDDPLPFLPELAAGLTGFRFQPVFLNAQAGVVVRF